MEGLIPMVYKSLKKTKTRRQYQCLSSGAAQTFNIAELNVKDDDLDHLPRKQYSSPPGPDVGGLGGAHHRRYNSVSVVDYASDRNYEPNNNKQLVRFRSHRMFSCVTGGA